MGLFQACLWACSRLVPGLIIRDHVLDYGFDGRPGLGSKYANKLKLSKKVEHDKHLQCVRNIEKLRSRGFGADHSVKAQDARGPVLACGKAQILK